MTRPTPNMHNPCAQMVTRATEILPTPTRRRRKRKRGAFDFDRPHSKTKRSLKRQQAAAFKRWDKKRKAKHASANAAP